MNRYKCVKCENTFSMKYELKRTGDQPVCPNCEQRKFHAQGAPVTESTLSSRDVEVGGQKLRVDMILRHRLMD
ncbi:MAG: hypothetical protein COS85_06865 [Armatimonadetes bacterium CG07_land_8_20_14_0_80_59_28]|nr:MAG: hypothetical protein COS85_06865 [Armatimonadetes bacterium CG07_land_8_20_14_0_80_59_28]PIX43453.1 MAG: hypothetical protein COZ56_07065 [Armatimonadetes bacterium CG_4_8_14_3_um_filter_58_9]PIY49455.1 MAG: hypothetical protein COZ05_00320 [Armatimonadetes bacterium CG_4_10_14_3_um_filter_59_10]PJB61867.1 MAG: hypothetical protein CO095_19805 [Armatimonadetes bacterium CG_4_9_14_3_um_filter_58_7]